MCVEVEERIAKWISVHLSVNDFGWVLDGFHEFFSLLASERTNTAAVKCDSLPEIGAELRQSSQESVGW